MGNWKMLFDRAPEEEPNEEYEKANSRMLELLGLEAEDGGEGSGNFGHKGRPGERGGSGGGGSSESNKNAEYMKTLKSKCDEALNIKRIGTSAYVATKITGEYSIQFVRRMEALERTLGPEEARNEIRKKLESFQAIMEYNGDPTPEKETVDANHGVYETEETLRGQAAVDFLDDLTGTNNGDRYRDAIESYSGGDWEHMTDDQKDALNELVENGKVHNGPIYRGLNFNSESERDNYLKQMVPGAEFGMRDNSISSWSTYASIADDFSTRGGESQSGVIIKSIQNRTGVPIAPVSDFPQEHEVLCSKDARWTVIGVEKNEQSGNVEITCVERGA